MGEPRGDGSDRDHASAVALVACALGDVTHDVGAVFVSRQVGRSMRTQYGVGDDVGAQFQIELGHLVGPLQLCERCSPGGLVTYWTCDLEAQFVAMLAE
ncbi:hypothetical protein [Halosimplex sp. TS25]|uniref:DUF7558 family protein n=1 Tax=Halosimplex rarum TaxID=3396619 RepID=UPI0039EB952B